jgi:hypothetical protein
MSVLPSVCLSPSIRRLIFCWILKSFGTGVFYNHKAVPQIVTLPRTQPHSKPHCTSLPPQSPHISLPIFVQLCTVCPRFGTEWYSLVQNGTVWYRVVQFCTEWYILVQFGTDWYSLVQISTDWYRLVQIGTVWHRLVQIGTDWYNLYRLVQFGTYWYSLVHTGTDWYSLVQISRDCNSFVQIGTVLYRLIQIGADWRIEIRTAVTGFSKLIHGLHTNFYAYFLRISMRTFYVLLCELSTYFPIHFYTLLLQTHGPMADVT